MLHKCRPFAVLPLFFPIGLDVISVCGHWLVTLGWSGPTGSSLWSVNRKWGSSLAVCCAVNSQQLCAIFQEKPRTPLLHLVLSPLKSPALPPSHSFSVLQTNHFHTSNPLLSQKSPSECHALTLSPWGPIIFSPAAIHDGPAAFPTLYFWLPASPAVPSKGPLTKTWGPRWKVLNHKGSEHLLLYWATS